MIKTLTRFLTRYSKLLFAIAVGLMLLQISFTEIPRVESNLEGYNTDNNPYYSVGQRMASLFGSKNLVQVLVKPETTTTKKLFEGIKDVEDEIELAFPGIRVESINSAKSLVYRRIKDSSSVREMLLEALKIPVAQNLVGNDTASFLLVAFADNAENFDPDMFDSIIEKKYQGVESMVAISQAHIQEEIDRSIRRDYLYILPVIIVLIIGLLYLFFRSFSAIAFCFFNVSISFIPALFFLSLFDVFINQVTSSVLPVVVILSLSSSVHLLTGYVHRLQIASRDERIAQTLSHYLVPSLLSTITTAIAFGSFFLSDSLYIRQFGTVTAASILVVFLLTFLISPFTLRLVRVKSSKSSSIKGARLLENFLLKYSKHIAIGLIFIALFSTLLVSRITFKTNLETFIPRHTKAFSNNEQVKATFHSIAEIDLLIEANDALSDSIRKQVSRNDLISLVSAFSQEIDQYPEVVSVQSIKNQIDFENHFTMPGFRATLFPRSTNPFVSKDQMKYRINIKLSKPDDIWTVYKRIAEDFKKHEPRYAFGVYSDFLFFNHISSSVTDSLLRSLLFSALLIVCIILLLTQSLKKTLISILANAIPLGFLVVIFVAFGIDMNISTSITLVVCLGLIVDDTIHILYRRVRLSEPLMELGFGILATSLIITSGFLTFALSNTRPNQVFGLLCALVFIVAMVSDMTVMSWLLPEKKEKSSPNE